MNAFDSVESYGDYWQRMAKLARRQKERGFTLIGLLVALTVISILAAFGSSLYNGYIERARIAHAIGDVGEIYLKVETFTLNHNRYPANLNDLGFSKNDPWGNPYVFVMLSSNGEARKNRNMVPVNAIYDIYSMGADGKTASPFTSTTGGDDVVMAGNGTYFGLALDY